MGTYAWNILYSKILRTESRAWCSRPATQVAPSQAVHRNLATGPYSSHYSALFTLRSHGWTNSYHIISSYTHILRWKSPRALLSSNRSTLSHQSFVQQMFYSCLFSHVLFCSNTKPKSKRQAQVIIQFKLLN